MKWSEWARENLCSYSKTNYWQATVSLNVRPILKHLAFKLELYETVWRSRSSPIITIFACLLFWSITLVVNFDLVVPFDLKQILHNTLTVSKCRDTATLNVCIFSRFFTTIKSYDQIFDYLQFKSVKTLHINCRNLFVGYDRYHRYKAFLACHSDIYRNESQFKYVWC